MQRMSSIIIYIIILQIKLSYSSEPLKHNDNPKIEYALCVPIVQLPNSDATAIHRKLLGTTEIEFAIFSSDNGGFYCILIRSQDQKYFCEKRSILSNDICNDYKLELTLLSKCKVDIKSREIDKKMVGILKETMKKQIIEANYVTKPDNQKMINETLDASCLYIYVKGLQHVELPMYAAAFSLPKFDGSYNCMKIDFVLDIYVENKDNEFSSIPINKLTTYLINKKEGKDAGPDPMIQKPLPEPDMTPPH